MNSNRLTTNLSEELNKSFLYNINPNWLMGFIEADGTYGIKNNSPYLQIAQKNTSKYTLNAIKDFITTLPGLNNKPDKVLSPNVISTINKNTNVISLTINSIDSLYFYLLPILDESKMYSRKKIDFKLWKIALILHKLGYYYIPEGKQLLNDIYSCINKSRYSTTCKINNVDNFIDEIFIKSEKLFAQVPLFNISLNKTHLNFAQEISIQQRKLTSNIVFIYKDNELIQGSPFISYSDANEALGLNRNSKICNRYINTGKLYKKLYLFSSKPLNN